MLYSHRSGAGDTATVTSVSDTHSFISVRVVTEADPPFSVTADSLGSLKTQIMQRLSLTEMEMKQRILVQDDRDFADMTIRSHPTPVGRWDLLESQDGFSLTFLGLNDGDQLRLSWKLPFTVDLLTPTGRIYDPFYSQEIRVSPYDTVAKLKKKIEEATGEPATKENLPNEFFSDGVDNKTILSLGFYAKSINNPFPQFSIERKKQPGFRWEHEGMVMVMHI